MHSSNKAEHSLLHFRRSRLKERKHHRFQYQVERKIRKAQHINRQAHELLRQEAVQRFVAQMETSLFQPPQEPQKDPRDLS